MDYAKELIKLAAVANPVEKPKAEDWEAVEKELGFIFPLDFKEVVSTVESGQFGVGLCLHNPCASSSYSRLSHLALLEHQELVSDLEEICVYS